MVVRTTEELKQMKDNLLNGLRHIFKSDKGYFTTYTYDQATDTIYFTFTGFCGDKELKHRIAARRLEYNDELYWKEIAPFLRNLATDSE